MPQTLVKFSKIVFLGMFIKQNNSLNRKRKDSSFFSGKMSMLVSPRSRCWKYISVFLEKHCTTSPKVVKLDRCISNGENTPFDSFSEFHLKRNVTRKIREKFSKAGLCILIL